MPKTRAYRGLSRDELVRLWNQNEVFRWADKCNVAFHTDRNVDQNDYAFFDDDAGLGSATQIGTDNNDPTLDTDTTYRWRCSIEGFSGDTDISILFQFEFNNTTQSTDWTAVTGSSQHVRSANGTPTDGSDVGSDGNPLADSPYSGGNTTYIATGNGGYDEGDGETGTYSWTLNDNWTEVEFAFQIRSADVNDGDNIQLRCRFSDNSTDRAGEPFEVYTNVPNITVNEGATPPVGTLSGEIQALSMTAAGEQQFLGTGDLQGQPAELDASAHMVPEGTADLITQDAELAAAGEQPFTGAADLQSQTAELDASGESGDPTTGTATFERLTNP